MEKEYGKLTSQQFGKLIGSLPEIRKQQVELRELVKMVPKERIDQLLISDYNWGEFYELPFVEHLALVVIAFNLTDTVIAAAESPDPQQQILDAMESLNADPCVDIDQAEPQFFEKQDLIGLLYSLQRTILSIMLFQRTISDLVRDVRENGNLDALFNVIRVDRAAVACPSIADRIARAELSNDKHFFIRFRNALKGPQKKHWEGYCDLRYSLFALRELGFDKLTDLELEKLLVHTLKVYPDNPGARKNLRRQYQLSKKISTI